MSGLADRVLARDRRLWNLAAVATPPREDEDTTFEHDIAAGQNAGIAMLVVVLTLVFVLIARRPDSLVFPWYLWVVLAAAAVVVGAQATVDTSSYTVEAITDPTEHAPGELWVGTVVGRRAAAKAIRQVGVSLRRKGRPDEGGPLQLVGPVR